MSKQAKLDIDEELDEELDEDKEFYDDISSDVKELFNKIRLPPPGSNNPNLSVDLTISKPVQIKDDNRVLVIILQCETRQCDNNIDNLKWIFSDPYFIVQVCKVPEQILEQALEQLAPTPESENIKIPHKENYNMQKVLKYASEGPYFQNEKGDFIAQKWWNNLPVIIIKDSSMSHITPEGKTNNKQIIGGMKKKIKIALEREKEKEADLYFLCKWNDACDKYSDVDEDDPTLKWSMKPTATQAILYIPSARDYISEQLLTTKVTLSELLNSHIEKEKLAATVFVPNLIDYDINLAVNETDFAKVNQFDPKPLTSTNTTMTTTQFIWIIIIIIILIIVAFIIIRPTMYIPR